MRWLKVSWLQLLTHLAALSPLAILLWDLTQGQLGANPIEEITLRTGKTTLVLLVLSLACTPIDILSGIRQVLSLRRTLGLYAFFYVCLHFLVFVGLDYGFNFALIIADISDKRFALVGFAAFLSLIPLAITSTIGWLRRLGRSWRRLHWLAYPAVLLAVAHFTLQEKIDLREPLLYATLVILLLIIRLPWVRSAIVEFRHRPGRSI